jgi:hypothetical protein
VPFPIAITVPDLPPAWMFYPYHQTAITILAQAPLDHDFIITVNPPRRDWECPESSA